MSSKPAGRYTNCDMTTPQTAVALLVSVLQSGSPVALPLSPPLSSTRAQPSYGTEALSVGLKNAVQYIGAARDAASIRNLIGQGSRLHPQSTPPPGHPFTLLMKMRGEWTPGEMAQGLTVEDIQAHTEGGRQPSGRQAL